MDVQTEGLHSLLLLEDTLDREVERLEEELIWHRRKQVYLQALGCPEVQLDDLNLTIRKSEGVLATMKQLLQQTYLERKICSEELQNHCQSRPTTKQNSNPSDLPPSQISIYEVRQHRLRRRHHRHHHGHKIRLNKRRQEKHLKASPHHTCPRHLHHIPPREPLASTPGCCPTEIQPSDAERANNSIPTSFTPVSCMSPHKSSPKLDSACCTTCHTNSEEASTNVKDREEMSLRRRRTKPSLTYRPLRCGRRKSKPGTETLGGGGVLKGEHLYHGDDASILLHQKISQGEHLFSTSDHLDMVRFDSSFSSDISIGVTAVTAPATDLVLWRSFDNVGGLQDSQSREADGIDPRNSLEVSTFVPYSCYSSPVDDVMSGAGSIDLRQD